MINHFNLIRQLVLTWDPKKEAQAICSELVAQTGDLQKELVCLRDLLGKVSGIFTFPLYNLSKLRIHSGQSVTAGTFAAHKSEGVQSRLENWSAEGSQRALRVRLESDSEWRPCAKRRPKRCSLSYLLTLLGERAKYFYRSSRSLQD